MYQLLELLGCFSHDTAVISAGTADGVPEGIHDDLDGI